MELGELSEPPLGQFGVGKKGMENGDVVATYYWAEDTLN